MERIIKSQPISNVFDVVSKHPALILNDRPGTKDILYSLMEDDPDSFAKMAVNLKSSGGENIMHFMAKENLIDFAIDLIKAIERIFDRITATELMFSRNLMGGNSPMMIMIRRAYMTSKNLSDEEKDKIISIWNTCVENPWVNDGIIEEDKPERFHLLLFSIKDSIFPIHMIGKFCYKQEER